RQPFDGAGNLDEDIRAPSARMKVDYLRECRLGVVREQRRDFERHVSIDTAGALKGRTEQVGGARDVVERELEEKLFGCFARLQQPATGVVVGGAVLDRMVEDGRI